MGLGIETIKGWFNKAAESDPSRASDPVAAQQEAEIKRMIAAEFHQDTVSDAVRQRWSALSDHSRTGVTTWINRQASQNGASVMYREDLLSSQ